MSMPGWHDSQARRSQNGEVIGPLTGQIMLPRAALDRAGGQRPVPPARSRSCAWIFACCGLAARRGRPRGAWRSARTSRSACCLPACVLLVADARARRARSLTPATSLRRASTTAVTCCWRASSAARRFVGRGRVGLRRRGPASTIRRSWSEMRAMNSPRSSRSAKPLELRTP